MRQLSDDFRVHGIQHVQLQARKLYSTGCPRDSFQVYISKGEFSRIFEHARQNLPMGHEVAGALLGRAFVTPEQIIFTEITEALPLHGATSRGSDVEVPADEWTRAHRHAEEHSKLVVGWYHSHPEFDVHMSAVDRHNHSQHFEEDWQVAIVIDPAEPRVRCWYSPAIRECDIYITPEPPVPVAAQAYLQDLSSTVDRSDDQRLQILQTKIETLLRHVNSLREDLSIWKKPEDSGLDELREGVGQIQDDFIQTQRVFSQRLEQATRQLGLLAQSLEQIKEQQRRLDSALQSLPSGMAPQILGAQDELIKRVEAARQSFVEASDQLSSQVEILEREFGRLSKTIDDFFRTLHSSLSGELDGIRERLEVARQQQIKDLSDLISPEKVIASAWQHYGTRVMGALGSLGLVIVLLTAGLIFTGTYAAIRNGWVQEFVAVNTPASQLSSIGALMYVDVGDPPPTSQLSEAPTSFVAEAQPSLQPQVFLSWIAPPREYAFLVNAHAPTSDSSACQWVATWPERLHSSQFSLTIPQLLISPCGTTIEELMLYEWEVSVVHTVMDGSIIRTSEWSQPATVVVLP